MKPTVPDDGSIQQQIGSAYDVVKSVADNLPAIITASTIVEEAQESVAEITEQIELATIAVNNANQVVATIEVIKNDTIAAKNLTEGYKNTALSASASAESAKNTVVPLAADFQSKWPTFISSYNDINYKYGQITVMHDDVDADRIAAENARNKAELWANNAVDAAVETGKFSAKHWATKASGFNSLAQGYANTATTKATEASQSASAASNSVTLAAGHVTTANQKAAEASNSATVALGHKDLAFTYKEEAKAFRDQASAIVGENYVLKSTTINGLPLTSNIVLNAGHVNAQPVDADLTSIAGLTGTLGLLRKTAANTWILDTATYLTSVPAQSWASITGKPTTVDGYNISDAAKANGVNATGIWPITANSSLSCVKIAQTPDTGGTNSTKFCKFLTVVIDVRYNEYTGLVNLLMGGSGAASASNEFLTLRVKQQEAFGSNPGIDCQSSVISTPYGNTVIGYTIVQNTPITIVEFYIQINNGWTGSEFVILHERISGGTTSRTWHNLGAFADTVPNFVAGTRNYLVKTSDVTNKVFWSSLRDIDPTINALANTSTAANKLIYFTGTDTTATTDLTSFGRSLIDDADAAAARTTLGLGSAATLASSAFQASDATLTAMAGITTAADRYIFFTGADVAAAGTITSFGRSLIDDATASDARTTLGLGDASVRNVMTSLTDTTTVDALMPRGAFGLGGSTTQDVDCDTITHGGLYRATAGTRPAPYSTSSWHIIDIHRSATTTAQLAICDTARTNVQAMSFRTRTDSQPYSDWSHVYHSGNLKIMTSLTDTTTLNALMPRGAFGIGSTIPPTHTVPLNDLIVRGTYNVTGGTTDWPFGSSGGTITVDSHGANSFITQTANSAATNVKSVRFKGATTWSRWFTEYSQANILGTVSQTAGVPTGAIIQRGLNFNGEYVAFADGTQICWHKTDDTAAPNKASGNVFKTDEYYWYYPVDFSNDGVSFTASPNDVSQSVWAGTSVSLKNKAACTGFSTQSTPYLMGFSLMVIGRWYN